MKKFLFTLLMLPLIVGANSHILEPKYKVQPSSKSQASLLKKCINMCYNRDKIKLKIIYLNKLLKSGTLTLEATDKHKSQIEVAEIQLKLIEKNFKCQCNQVLDNLSFLKEDK